MKFTQEKIDEYKKKYGKIFIFTSGEMSCICRRAGRNDLSLANVSAVSTSDSGARTFDVQKFNESILTSTWVDGDQEILTDDKFFLGISEQLDTLIEKAKFEVAEI